VYHFRKVEELGDLDTYLRDCSPCKLMHDHWNLQTWAYHVWAPWGRVTCHLGH